MGGGEAASKKSSAGAGRNARRTTPANIVVGSAGMCRARAGSGGAAVEVVEGFIAAQAGAQALEGAVFIEAGADRFDRLARLLGDGLDFAIQFVVGDGDVFLFGDAIEDE